MEWMNRGEGQGQPAGQALNHSAASATAARPAKAKKSGIKGLLGLQFAQIALLFSVTILVAAVAVFIAFGGGKSEGSYVDSKKLQAVFLNGGQVYFGNINDLNGKFLSMSGIYYLRVNQQVQPDANSSTSANDISLVKLGCELHGPQDNMVINREQVIFWENLKDDGQVAKAVKDYQTQNPNGQKCDQASTSTPSTTTPSTTDTTKTPTTTTPTNTTTKKSQ
jgi:hypothetical protein